MADKKCFCALGLDGANRLPSEQAVALRRCTANAAVGGIYARARATRFFFLRKECSLASLLSRSLNVLNVFKCIGRRVESVWHRDEDVISGEREGGGERGKVFNEVGHWLTGQICSPGKPSVLGAWIKHMPRSSYISFVSLPTACAAEAQVHEEFACAEVFTFYCTLEAAIHSVPFRFCAAARRCVTAPRHKHVRKTEEEKREREKKKGVLLRKWG